MNKLIAHRGLISKNVLENTYFAIKNALDSPKYMGVEFDVRMTKDHELIIYHDAYYNSKLIKNTTYKELPKYVPRLEEILKINSKKIFLIEVKNIGDDYSRFIKILKKYKNKNIYVMSFSNNIIKKLNVSNRNYKIGILNYILNTTDLIQNLDFIGILNSLINEDILKTFKDIEVFSYGLIEKIKYKDVYYIVESK